MAAAPVLSLYQALLALSQRQLLALEMGEEAVFEGLLEEREARFEQLRAREAEVEALTGEDRQALTALIGAILESDAALTRAMTAATQASTEELSALHTGLSALNSYAQRLDSREAIFIDHAG